MADFNAPRITDEMGLNELRDTVAKLSKMVQFMFDGRIDSKNALEFGGFLVGPDFFRSRNGLVGLSSAEIDNPQAVRIWAGSAGMYAAPFQVLQSGAIVSTKGYIGGFIIAPTSLTDSYGTFGFDSTSTVLDDIRIYAGTLFGYKEQAKFRVTEGGAVYCSNLTAEGGYIRTGPVGSDRLELSGGKFRGLTSSGRITGLYFDIGTVGGGNGVADLLLYHNDVPLLVMYDDFTKYSIRGTSSSSGMTLGGFTAPTFAAGEWSFNSSGSVTFNGNVSGIPMSGVTGLQSEIARIYAAISSMQQPPTPGP
ncbi:hypothetical protein [Paenibacillus chitinolyticus]|uniref:hypothetical protein n=1 Tax=Paenibacillus chitinolyticus TaxID=79263 RepID=UPI003667EB55